MSLRRIALAAAVATLAMILAGRMGLAGPALFPLGMAAFVLTLGPRGLYRALTRERAPPEPSHAAADRADPFAAARQEAKAAIVRIEAAAPRAADAALRDALADIAARGRALLDAHQADAAARSDMETRLILYYLPRTAEIAEASIALQVKPERAEAVRAACQRVAALFAAAADAREDGERRDLDLELKLLNDALREDAKAFAKDDPPRP